jgi:hypothetical protein
MDIVKPPNPISTRLISMSPVTEYRKRPAHKADKNMSLATLQALMGHKKKETTLKYIHIARNESSQGNG